VPAVESGRGGRLIVCDFAATVAANLMCGAGDASRIRHAAAGLIEGMIECARAGGNGMPD
jgi:hypothetical protein